ncbi:hypothetical protein CYMTET_40083 [Cymbomonas tetramitiformis]|uniref:S1 motif domain-containing protein n=1 Tax=Cymbomonas tetramitiformis TaxID=36881 RepID=A0AAE0F4Z0_9CHLO|nr:hypothetical protein CYMTET_40083 [Cymbomonas tetramitiformis]
MRVAKFTADEDSNMIAAINDPLGEVPRELQPVEKLSDPNHLQKLLYTEALEELRKEKKWSGGTLSKTVIDYFNKLYRYVVKFWDRDIGRSRMGGQTEVDFPRGKVASTSVKSGDSSTKRKSSTNSASNKKQKKQKAAKEEEFFLSDEPISRAGKLPKYVELLKHKTLSVGMKLWGAVLEVNERDLAISLPHGLRGYVTPDEASDVLAEMIAASPDSESDEESEPPPKAGRKVAAGAARKLGSAPPSLSELFRPNQIVRCTVIGLSTKGKPGKERKRIDLSLRLSTLLKGTEFASFKEGLAMPACVRSVEDHGYVLSFGVPGVSGFLLQEQAKDAAAAAGGGLACGALLETVISKIDAKKKEVGTSANEMEGVNIGNLMPGMLVSAKVRAVLPDGLLVTFLSYFTGTVDWYHLDTELPAAKWGEAYKVGQRLQARVLYVDPQLKRAGLTLKRHLVESAGLIGGPVLPSDGLVIKGATVHRVDKDLGLLLSFQESGAKQRPLYAHISELKEERVEKVEKAFKTGQQVTARVIGFRMMDSLPMVSLKPSKIEQEIFTFEDARPGRDVTGTILSIQPYGVLLLLGEGIKALCTTPHLTDVPRQAPSAKLKENTQMTVRVLERDDARRKILVTHKKTLLKSRCPPTRAQRPPRRTRTFRLRASLPGSASPADRLRGDCAACSVSAVCTMAPHSLTSAVRCALEQHGLVTSYDDGQPGLVTHGVVTGLEDYGVFVTFYNGVKGIARVADLGLAADQTVKEAFSMHQVVKCKVLGPDSFKVQRLRLSLAPGTLTTGAEEDSMLAPGTLVEGRVAVAQDSKSGSMVDVVVWRAGEAEGKARTEVRALLDTAQLSDHPAAVEAIKAALVLNSELGTMVVLEGGKSLGAPLTVSRKASLVAAAATLPKAIGDFTAGAMHPGFVASVTDGGCFVRFLGRLTGRWCYDSRSSERETQMVGPTGAGV